MSLVNIDARIENADWTKKTWDLPQSKDELLDHLAFSGQTVETFKALPAYALNKDKLDWLKTL